MKSIKIKSLFQIFLVLSLSFVGLSFSNDVYAAEGCCEYTTGDNPSYCDYVDESQCGGSFAPTSCETTSFCGTGTCVVDGYCYDNTPKGRCLTEYNGRFETTPSSELAQCKLGCCLIGTQANYITRDQCITATQAYPDLEVDFRDTASEQACLDLARSSVSGCCVTDNSCVYGAKSNCNIETTVNGTGFYEDTYCSELRGRGGCDCAPANPSPSLNGEGLLQDTGCLDISDSVYWFDSCGNPEGVVESGLRDYSNVGKDNGECDYSAGNICGASDKDPEVSSCQTVNCEVSNGDFSFEQYNQGKMISELDGETEVNNGESWCLWDYKDSEDATRFYGKDAPGSRHYRSLCINGQELIEPCEDFRREYCFSAGLKVHGVETRQNDNFLASRCLQNDKWSECTDSCGTADSFNMNQREYAKALEDDYQCCTDISRDCQWVGSEPDNQGNVAGGKCVPAVAPGYKFWEGEGIDQCSKGSLECKATFVCNGWNSLLNACEVGETSGRVAKLVTFEVIAAGVGFAVASAGFGLIGAAGAMAAFGIMFAASGEGFDQGWNLVSGGECFSRDYLQASNNYCRSLGDCGADYNYLYDKEVTLDGFTNTEDIELIFGEDEEKGFTDVLIEMGQDGIVQNIVDVHEDFSGEVIGKNDIKGGFEYIKLGIKQIPGKFTKDDVTWEGGNKFFDFAVKQEDGVNFAKRFLNRNGWGWGLAGFGIVGVAGATLGGVASSSLSGVFTGLTNVIPGLTTAVVGISNLEFVSGKAGGLLDVGNVEALKAAERANKELVIRSTASEILAGVNAGMWVYTVYKVIDTVAEQQQEITVSTTCQTWQAPAVTSEDQCELCNPDTYLSEDGTSNDLKAFKKCSEYRCKSLGASCELINKGSEEESCVSMFRFDVNPPVIDPWEEELSDGYSVEGETDNGFRVIYNNDNDNDEIEGEIQTYKNFVVGLELNKPSQCKMSFDKGNRYEDMDNTYFGGNLYTRFKVQSMFYPASKQTDETTGEATLTGGGPYELAVRCQDAAGNANERDYVIKFNVDEGPDLTAPKIVGSSVVAGTQDIGATEVYVTSGAADVPVILYVDEDATCRYDFSNQEYERLAGGECSTTGAGTNGRFACGFSSRDASFATSSIAIGESKAGLIKHVYFKCKDDKDNFNKDPYRITFKGTNNLTVSSIITDPAAIEGEIKTSLATAPVKLRVRTDEGAKLNGDAICKYYWKLNPSESDDASLSKNLNTMTAFATTGNNLHEQEFTNLPSSEELQRIYVGCEDVAGNRAFNQISFKILSDITPPVIVRAYQDDSFTPAVFSIEVNEKAACKDSTESEFNFETGGNPMDANGNVHTSLSEPSNLYWVVCKDAFGNTMSSVKIQFT